MNEPLSPIPAKPVVSHRAPEPTELSDFIPHLPDPTPRWWAGFQQSTFRWGLAAVATSALLFGGYDYYVAQKGTPNHFTLFVVHYSIAIVYALALWIRDDLQLAGVQPKQGRTVRMILLVLALISAYALNRDMPVFQESVPWLKGVLILACLLMMSIAWLDALPVRGQQALTFGLALVWCLFFYQTLYAVPYYLFGALGLILLGIGGHIFIPLLISISIGRVLWRSWKNHEHRRVAIVAGLFVPIAVTIGFVYQWVQVDAKIRYASNAIPTRKDDELPAWVLLAQHLPNDWMTERYLKTGSVYSQAGQSRNSLFDTQQELKRHDPLVFIATIVKKPMESWSADLGKLITTLYSSHHQHEERLWSGSSLRTTSLLTQARIYPEYRLAYTEKTLHIQNGGSGQQEALYTFHLPEGAVITSLSLWVNGREEKGILTTKAKADTAYRTVVGVERRDPSVVHWREGNRVTVRVFPCLPGQARQVKIGVTSPLRLENRLGQSQQLVYENAWFEGPDGRNAAETVKLEFSQEPQQVVWPEFLKPDFVDPPNRKQLIHESSYQPRWEVRFDAPALATTGFRLGANTYQLQPARQQMEPFNPQAVFLDLNRDWTEGDINKMLKMAGKRPVWVYDEGLVLLTDANRDEVVNRLLQQRFSVFPVYRIPDPASALLVTKSAETGPQLENLSGSPYAEALSRQPIDQPALRTFCLSNASEVVKTLGKLGVLQVDEGTFDDLEWLLNRQLFARQSVADASVVLPQSGVRIVRTESAETGHSNAAGVPDHLVRLFAYNQLLSQIGRHYFSKDYNTDSLIAKAQQAHIVSPVSSLIVLETQQDYDRFGIKKTQNSLDNATLKNTGAVPEPHEWALLVLLAIWVMYSWFKGRYVGI